MAVSGKWLSGDEIGRILSLLSSTEMTASQIAVRMGCSRSTVLTINRKYQVRLYNGRRAIWEQEKSPEGEGAPWDSGAA